MSVTLRDKVRDTVRVSTARTNVTCTSSQSIPSKEGTFHVSKELGRSRETFSSYPTDKTESAYSIWRRDGTRFFQRNAAELLGKRELSSLTSSTLAGLLDEDRGCSAPLFSVIDYLFSTSRAGKNKTMSYPPPPPLQNMSPEWHQFLATDVVRACVSPCAFLSSLRRTSRN